MTGVSGPVGGVQWERRDDDAEIARRVLNLLGDRRMLWKDFSAEIEEHCVASANTVRAALGTHLDHPDIGVTGPQAVPQVLPRRDHQRRGPVVVERVTALT